MSTLNLQPPRVPIVDPNTGLVTREWYRFFTDSFSRQGGHDAPTNTDLDTSMPEDSGVAELEFIVRSNRDDLSQSPPVPDVFTIANLDGGGGQEPTFVIVSSDEINQAPPYTQAMFDEIQYLQMRDRANSEEIALLKKQIEDIKQGTLL